MALDTGALRLARRLRELRTDAGLTQSVLANALSSEGKTVGSATVSSWESTTNPKRPPATRLEAYARFFSTERSYRGGTTRLFAATDLETAELEQYAALQEELLGIIAELPEQPLLELERRTLLDFDGGHVVIICPEAPAEERGPLADETSPNYSKLHGFADTDALIELFGHLRRFNPTADVFYRTAKTLQKGELQYHIILLGGVGWNTMTGRILDSIDLPVAQVEDPQLKTGDIFRLKQTEKSFFPVTDDKSGELLEDVALIARLPNPFNHGRTLTICNGIHSRGVVGAVLALTDETIRPSNEKFLADRFPSGSFATLVRVPVVAGDVLAPDLTNPAARLFEWDAPEVEG